ncbi:MAG: adenosylcobinamide-GDP ribazoletransferase [Leptolyngbya sp. DLM2.Bin15]|nr:MAG: adenosylcobinamide-GDP ribazoletransferase [Leptolyngbya sp. DLM2.Bin15]
MAFDPLNGGDWKAIAPAIAAFPRQLLAALLFYTQLPLTPGTTLAFERVACWAPVVGVLLGVGLGLGDRLLAAWHLPDLLRSSLVVCVWLWITGGLHLDGAMDTADGLAVAPDRRLAVMADSASGAFAVMVAIAILLLKTTALASLSHGHLLALTAAAGWGRWGQQVAIAYYPYLKATGKGALHQAALRSGWDLLPGLLLLLGVCALPLGSGNSAWPLTLLALTGGAIAPLVAYGFGRQLGGHTGDSYGAVVEWTETLILLVFAAGYPSLPL